MKNKLNSCFNIKIFKDFVLYLFFFNFYIVTVDNNYTDEVTSTTFSKDNNYTYEATLTPLYNFKDYNDYYIHSLLNDHCEYQNYLFDYWWPESNDNIRLLGFIYNNIFSVHPNILYNETNQLDPIDLSYFEKWDWKHTDMLMNKLIVPQKNDITIAERREDGHIDFTYRKYDVIKNFMNQQIFKFKKYKTYNECIADYFPKSNLRFLSLPKQIIKNNNNNLYKYITRSSINGNLLAVNGPYNKAFGNFANDFYIGRTIDSNGLINDNYMEFFFQEPSLNVQLNKEKINTYEKFLYDEISLEITCKSLLSDDSFDDFNNYHNYFYLCTDKNKNINDILINGNDFASNTTNSIGYIMDPIEKKNYDYEEINSRHQWFKTLSFQKDNNYTFQVMEKFNQVNSQMGRCDICLCKPDVDFYNYLLNPNVIFNGNIFYIQQLNFNSPVINNNEFNYKFKFLSWFMDLTADGSTFAQYKNPLMHILSPGISRIQEERGNIYLAPSSCTDNNNPDGMYQNNYDRSVNDNNLMGKTYIKEDGFVIIDGVMDNVVNNTLWFIQDFSMEDNINKGTITRVKYSNLWDGTLISNNFTDRQIIFSKNKDFYNLYNLNNNKNRSFTEAMFDISFFNNNLYNINYLPAQKFTKFVNNDLLNKAFYNVIIELYNDPAGEILWSKLESLDNMIIGCKVDCFLLDYQGFPLELLENFKEKNINVRNPFLSFNNTFSQLDLQVKNSWNLFQDNRKYFCNLNYLNIDGNNYLSLICFKEFLNNFSNIFFIYNIDKQTFLYSPVDTNNYWILNLLNSDKIYVSKKSKKGFSSIFHKNYPSNYFNINEPSTINIFNFNNQNIQNLDDIFIEINQKGKVVIKNNLYVNKITGNKLNYNYTFVGNGNNGLIKICQHDKNKQLFCVDGDLESSIVYYNQNYNNNPTNINKFTPLEPIYLGEWLNKFKDIFNNKQEKKYYSFMRPPIAKNFSTIYQIDNYPINCKLVLGSWFTDNSWQFPLANYCSHSKSNFIELLLYPQYNTKTNALEKVPSQWFLCETSKSFIGCEFFLFNGTFIKCDENHCYNDIINLNNNFIDRLNDPILINLLNKQYNLQIQELISFHPSSEFLFKSFIHSSLEGVVSFPVFLQKFDNFNHLNIYTGIYGILNIIVIGSLFFIRKYWEKNNSEQTSYCFHTGFFYLHGLILGPFIMKLIIDIILSTSSEFSMVQSRHYIYNSNNINYFWGQFSINIILMAFIIGVYIFIKCKTWKRLSKENNKSFSCTNENSSYLFINILSYFLSLFLIIFVFLNPLETEAEKIVY